MSALLQHRHLCQIHLTVQLLYVCLIKRAYSNGKSPKTANSNQCSTQVKWSNKVVERKLMHIWPRYDSNIAGLIWVRLGHTRWPFKPPENGIWPFTGVRGDHNGSPFIGLLLLLIEKSKRGPSPSWINLFLSVFSFNPFNGQVFGGRRLWTGGLQRRWPPPKLLCGRGKRRREKGVRRKSRDTTQSICWSKQTHFCQQSGASLPKAL